MARAFTLPVPGGRSLGRVSGSSLVVVRGVLGPPFATRRKLQLALALFWLLDGVLQLQPFMFTRGFATHVIAPSAAGQPAFVAAGVHLATSVILSDPPLWNAFFAVTQLAIGGALLFRRSARPAIVASISWALGVWALGEGFGGLVGGTATLLTGAPGAVILYALVALAAWPRLEGRERAVLTSRGVPARQRLGALLVPAADERTARWLPAAWAGLWSLFALLQALPANSTPAALAGQLRANMSSAPGWLAHAQRSLAALAGRDGVVIVTSVVAVELAIGLLALWRGTPRRVAAVAGIGLAVAFWVLGQAFGQISTGMGTDPSSGPLVALLGMTLLGSTARTRSPVEQRGRARPASHPVVPALRAEAI